MATQTIEFVCTTGQTVTAKLFNAGSDTVVVSSSATEETNRKGVYLVSYTDVPAGSYRLIAFSGSTPLAVWWVDLTLTTATFQAYEHSQNSIADSILTRNVSYVESFAAEHTLATLVLANLEWSISTNILTIKRTDGTTTHYTKTLSTNEFSNEIIVGLN